MCCYLWYGVQCDYTASAHNRYCRDVAIELRAHPRSAFFGTSYDRSENAALV